MATESKFQKVYFVGGGGISFVYQAAPGIVIKVPQSEDFARQQFRHEVEIYKAISKQAACAFIVKRYYSTDDGIFLEYMRDGTLSYRIQINHKFDRKAWVVTPVERLEPLHLRLAWMNDLAQPISMNVNEQTQLVSTKRALCQELEEYGLFGFIASLENAFKRK
ncbi:hypothetical protein N7540_003365 [Penicillium herquei]|nr:hypothetical protein N7540_003365 [Penicillium herquei]